MKASVIIPTKNPGEIFQQVISSVLRQKFSGDFEVIVVDSGSVDGTLDYIDSLRGDKVRLIQIPPEEFGHGRTRNLAVSESTGEYAVLLTHDATPVDEYWLESLVSIADADKDIAGVFGRHLAYPSADPYTTRELEQHFEGFKSEPIVGLSNVERYWQEDGYRQFLHFFSDNNALIRKSVWKEIPYPDVNFAEDQLWAKTIIESGYKKAYSFEGAVYHSHAYRLVERLQRSFDESYAFRRLFGYKLCAGPISVLQSFVAVSLRDVKYAVSEQLFFRAPIQLLHRVVSNFMRAVGTFFGCHGDRLPEAVRRRLSWDNRLLLGLDRTNVTRERV